MRSRPVVPNVAIAGPRELGYDMTYAVIDTNVFVAAFLSRRDDSATVRIMRALGAGGFVPLYNAEILDEYREVLSRPKSRIASEVVDALLWKVQELGKPSERMPSAEEFPDEDDRVFYEVTLCHVERGAKLVTGNARHYPQKPFVITASEFVGILGEKGSRTGDVGRG